MPQFPRQRAECVIHHSPGDVAHNTLLLSAVASFFASCGGSRRWTALRCVGFAKLFNVLCYMTWLSEFWLPTHLPAAQESCFRSSIAHCLDLAGPDVSLFPSRSMRRMSYLFHPNSLFGIGRLGGWVISPVSPLGGSPLRFTRLTVYSIKETQPAGFKCKCAFLRDASVILTA